MKLFSSTVVTRKYAVKASLYRRLVRKMGGFSHTFTKDDLEEMYAFETFGKDGKLFSELKSRNGFAFGKWLRDIDVVQMIQDVTSGDFVKYEFLDTAHGRIHNQSVLDKVYLPSPNWFFGCAYMSNILHRPRKEIIRVVFTNQIDTLLDEKENEG